MNVPTLISQTAVGLRPAGRADTFLKRLMHRKYEMAVPPWDHTPYGDASDGLFWGAHREWEHHRFLMRTWAASYYLLGSLGILLSAFAGFGGVSSLLGAKTAAYITIGASAAIGLAIFLRCDDKRREHNELVNAWDKLRNDVAILYTTRPGNDGNQQQTNGARKAVDPDTWQAVIQALQEHSDKISRGDLSLEPLPAWPDKEPV